MKMNSNLMTGAIGTFLGILSGTAVTAYAMGLEKATITQSIQGNKTDIDDLKRVISDQLIISNGHLDQINTSVHQQAIAMGEIKGDIKTLEAIVKRIEDKK